MNWSRYSAEEVKRGIDDNGNRLLSAFAKDYHALFNSEICPTCRDFENKFKNYLKTIEAMANKDVKNSGYSLKHKYQNIPLEFGSRVFVNNRNLSDEYAQTLLETHPRGKDLFETMPEGSVELSPVEELVKNNSKNDLIEMAVELGIEDVDGNKTEIATLIVAAQSNE